jgi:glucan biosynthesis protein C
MERQHALDNLRGLAMLAGVLFHALLAYSPLMRPYWPAADRDGAPAVDLLIWLMHLVRMPLFFAIAGTLAALAVQRRGLGAFVRGRLRRIALPLLLLGPPLIWAMGALTVHAAQTAVQPSPLLLWIRKAIDAGHAMPLPGSGHLWFLYYLLLFTVLIWVARQLLPAALALRLRELGPAPLLLGGPLLLALPLLTVTAPHPAPESWLPQFWALGYYGAFFGLGYLAQGSELITRCRPWLRWLLLGSVLAYALYLGRLAKGDWAVALSGACVSLWLSIACWLLAQRLLDRRQGVLRYIAESSYWTYLLHLPVLLALQYALQDQNWPWPLKLLLTLALTLAVCLASYQLLVRHTPLRRFVG